VARGNGAGGLDDGVQRQTPGLAEDVGGQLHHVVVARGRRFESGPPSAVLGLVRFEAPATAQNPQRRPKRIIPEAPPA
jgi:hypothetical protein